MTVEGTRRRPAASLPGVERLASRIEGRIFTEGHERFDDARRIWNARQDHKPAAIVRPKSVQDVVATARFAAANEYLLSARSGGHGIGGEAVHDGGITLDFSAWKRMEIDHGSRTARVQPGLIWAEVDAATQESGLAIPGGKVAAVGVGGLTLAGGIGWLARPWGLTVDHLRSVEIVTGDGRLLTASEHSHPDLFWGLRGAGSFLGIATSFEFDLVPVTNVMAGFVFYPIDRAEETLAFYRDFTVDAPGELTSVAALLHSPECGGVVGIGVTCVGETAMAERLLAPLRGFGPPVADMIGVMPYGLLQRQLAKVTPPGLNRSWKSGYLRSFDDELIAKAVDAFRSAPTPQCLILMEHHGGAIADVEPGDTAYPHRHLDYNLVIEAGWAEEIYGGDSSCWLANAWSHLQPFSTGGVYAGYLDTGATRGEDVFGGVGYTRLGALKDKLDPAHILASLPEPGLR